MTVKASYFIDVSGLKLSEETDAVAKWVHALPIGKYKHPVYGDIDVSAERSKRFADSVKNKVRGIDPSINYDHNNAGDASGWVKDAESRNDGLWLLVEWTKTAIEKIKEKAYKYFSTEFHDEWEDPQGNKHTDVIFGGALTNRPFIKDLVPVNLSETTIDTAFELVSAITGSDKDSLKGGNMPLSDEDLKKIVEGVATKLTETKVADPGIKKLTDIPELKALAEENPTVATLIKFVETQNIELATNAKSLKEAEIAAKLAEFDRSKIVLTPVARQLAQNIMMELDEELIEPFWKLMEAMKRGNSFLVELGERAGATVNYGSHKSAAKQFDELTAKLKTENKLSDADAYEQAARENPALYNSYRKELMEGAER
jgi:hypothetical protein